MGRTGWIVTLLSALLVGSLGALFTVQNGARTTQLSLDVGFRAWQLDQPVAIPFLLAFAFGAGLLVGVVFMQARAIRRGRHARRIEQDAAIQAAVTATAPAGESSTW